MSMRVRIICVLCSNVIAAASMAQETGPHAVLAEALFPTSDQCIACHSGMHTAAGEDVSIGYNWRASMMANSALDPYWHAGVRREVMDYPQAQEAIEDTCSTCHMPMERFAAAANGGRGAVFANLGTPPTPAAADGVSCTVCHQIQPDNLGEHESFDGGFVIDVSQPAERRPMFGPHSVDAGRQALMQSAARAVPSEATHLRESELCATCHTLYTDPLAAGSEGVDALPEQVPYLEWLASDYRETASCQACHMPELDEEVPISSVLGPPRPGFSRHVFQGGNAFMLGILSRHRGALGVRALPQELDAEIARTKRFLASSTARVAIEGAAVRGRALSFEVAVENLAGHKFPTAYPSRRAWLHVAVTDATGRSLFESGAHRLDGSIAGNANDEDARRFEPHYEEITSEDQVQIYEPIMVGPDGVVTTGLLTAVRYVKDNRLLPHGFDKSSAATDIASQGRARGDADFAAGGDRVRYSIELIQRPRGPLQVRAELRFQSIGYRWAHNLRAYDAAETNRFLSYYESAASGSALPIAAAEVQVSR